MKYFFIRESLHRMKFNAWLINVKQLNYVIRKIKNLLHAIFPLINAISVKGIEWEKIVIALIKHMTQEGRSALYVVKIANNV